MTKPTEPAKPSPARRPYAAPELVEYGSIAKLTQAGGSTRAESGVPVMRTCL